MTVPERILKFLRDNSLVAFCDDCIASQLGLPARQQAQQVTSTLASMPDFERKVGACQDCWETRKEVTRSTKSDEAAN